MGIQSISSFDGWDVVITSDEDAGLWILNSFFRDLEDHDSDSSEIEGSQVDVQVDSVSILGAVGVVVSSEFEIWHFA